MRFAGHTFTFKPQEPGTDGFLSEKQSHVLSETSPAKGIHHQPSTAVRKKHQKNSSRFSSARR